jgi:hypothetical protein
MISPICISTVTGKGLAVMLSSIKEYCPEVPVYLRGPLSVIDHFEADYKMEGNKSTHNRKYLTISDTRKILFAIEYQRYFFLVGT